MARVDGAVQKIRSKTTIKQVHNVGTTRSQSLVGKSFYLDLPSGKSLEFLAKSVKRFGGVVESFLSKEVTCLVSNSQEARTENCGGKQTVRLLRNARAGTQTSVGFERGHQDSSYKPADAVLVTRGKALLQKAIQNQSSTCDGNGILAYARSWGIQIMHTDEMVSYIQRLDLKSCRSMRQMKCFPSRPQSDLKVMRLQSPFLKIEDESRRLCPLLQQFKSFPELFFSDLRRHSPFDPPRPPASSKVPEVQPACRNSSSSSLVPKRQRGYCECCEEDFADLQMHLQSPQHTAFVLDATHYAPVDNLISQMTNDFAASTWSLQPQRIPLTASASLSGFQEDIVERVTASFDQPPKSCLSGDGSVGQSISPGPSTHFAEDQSFWEQMELHWENLGTPALLTSPSPWFLSGQVDGSSRTEHHRRGKADIDAPLEPAASPEVGFGASQQKKTWTSPTLLPTWPQKRKLSYSPHGQVKKRPALNGLLLIQPDTNVLPGISPVGTTQCSFPQECGSQADQGGFRLSTVPAAKPHCLQAPPQSPQGSSACPPREWAVTDSSCLTWPVQQLEQEEGFSAHASKEHHAQIPCKFPWGHNKPGIPGFPAGRSTSSQLLGPVVQPHSAQVGPSQFVQAVVLEGSSSGLPPLSCSEDPHSSASEWDRSFLCILEGTSHLPFENPLDSALLGTCINLRDSGYESHLCSVLQQTVKPHQTP